MPKPKESKLSIKQILISKQNWWTFHEKNKTRIRKAIVVCIVKLLSCRNTIRGYHEYACSNVACPHTKKIPHTCKSKACSSCGKKATEQWLHKQQNILPKTTWQHITFTMPDQLWDFFWCNRELLNKISKLAANTILFAANQRNVTPGILTALHTFGRNLKRNVHIHLCVTLGGLHQDTHEWVSLYFIQHNLMKAWRTKVVTLFREAAKNGQLVIPAELAQTFNHTFTFNHFLDAQYKKYWRVHCAKPSKQHKDHIHYCGRYAKRPPIAESKLRHYDGQEVTFEYLDHKTQLIKKSTLSAEQFIAKFIQHIPDVSFRMMRYYGFLANRVRGKLLPIVYSLINQATPEPITQKPTYAQLIKNQFNVDPFTCILCGQPLALIGVYFGKFKTNQLLEQHQNLAAFQNIA